jgi:hypothetical protein
VPEEYHETFVTVKDADAGASHNYRYANPPYCKFYCSQNQSIVQPGVTRTDLTQRAGMAGASSPLALRTAAP